MQKVQMSCTVEAGKLVLNRAAFAAQASQLPDGLYQVTVQKMTRSQQANAYYWGVVLKAIDDHTHQGTDDIHDAMCQMFLPNVGKQVQFHNAVSRTTVTVATETRRSSKLPSDAFYDFVEKVRAWAADFLSLTIPDPDPEYWRTDADH
jgi:hypothetical protein